MGKKVDLNARRNNGNFRKSTRNFNYNNNPSNLSQQDINSEESSNASGIGTNSYYNRREYELPESVNLTIKMPIPVKVAITAAVIGIPIILLTFLIILFGDDYTLYYANYELGQTCATVKVTDTENYIYDGEVSFDNYIAGVVAAESQGSHDLEYLKLLSVLARTYFFQNATSNCTVKGNSDFQQYKDIDDVNNKNIIRKAMEETKDYVITENNRLKAIKYNPGCVVRDDGSNYHIRYGKNNGQVKFQKIPKTWADEIWADEELLHLNSITELLIEELKKAFQEEEQTKKNENSEYEIKPFVVNYETVACPENTSDEGISKLGALYLITEKGYSYENVIEYYTEKKLTIIQNEINHNGKKTGNGEYINPTGTLHCTSPYGYRTHPVKGTSSFHSGIDIGVAGGTPIYSAKDGVVTKVVKNVSAINNCSYGYGNQIVINHEDGSTTLYAHIKYGTIPDSISAGSQISQGEQIGQVGSTGCSTGNHLHYEVLVNGSTVDPADYLDLTNASGTCKR